MSNILLFVNIFNLSYNATHGQPIVAVDVEQIDVVRTEAEELPAIDIERIRRRGPNVSFAPYTAK